MKKPRIDAFVNAPDSEPAPDLRSPLDDFPSIVPPARKSDEHVSYETGRTATVISKARTKDISKDDSRDTAIPQYRDTTASQGQEGMIETVRKAVKHLGKEAATYRFTEEEKKALSNVVFEYRNMRIRTSENEITRVAINFILEDYRLYGESSLLAKVLGRLKE